MVLIQVIMNLSKNVQILILIIFTILFAINCDNADQTSSLNPDLRSSLVQQNYLSNESGIMVTGVSSITLEPDMATLNLGVEARAGTVSEARNTASVSIDKVTSVLTSMGVENKDIQTVSFNIYPQYDYVEEIDNGRIRGGQILSGYTVSNMLVVNIKDLDQIGEIIDAVTNAGQDQIRINGVNFSVQDTVQFQPELRKLAVQDAVAKASQLSEYADVKLGKIKMIADFSSQPSISVDKNLFSERALAVPVTGINTGEITLTMQINVVFEIEN